jgi:anaerobic selenocysteine-containing dehydrogenase
MSDSSSELPTIDHTGLLQELTEVPPYLLAVEHAEHSGEKETKGGVYSCAYCGVGDSGLIQTRTRLTPVPVEELLPQGEGSIQVMALGQIRKRRARTVGTDRLEIETGFPLTEKGGTLIGELTIGAVGRSVVLVETGLVAGADGSPRAQMFKVPSMSMKVTDTTISAPIPTTGCVKMKISMGVGRSVFPIHVAPSVLDPHTGRRRSITYTEAIERLAELLLAHRAPAGKTLVYACGQVDYFTIWSFQEAFRLLGVRNLAGNAEHCLNSGAVHNEILTGQEGPFITLEQALDGPRRFYLLNGWNGMITHPPVFYRLLKRQDLDAFLVEVAVTESALGIASRLGPERVLLIRPGSDAHLALAVAHEVLRKHPQAVCRRFIDRFADAPTFDAYAALAGSDDFAPERVAERIAPETRYTERILEGIRAIAARLVDPDVVPINLPSVGLSQSKGAVPHCLWGSVLAMLGKYGQRAEGGPAGGTLRVPGQINAQTEVQGLSRNNFFGRIKVGEEGAAEAARRMGLPAHAYRRVLEDAPRAALDYSDPAAAGQSELFLFFGTQFESNMMGRRRWIAKLGSAGVTSVVMDPVPDPFSLEMAALIIPPPPHSAVSKLYQNGEWRLTLSMPRRRAPRETRTDPTVVYDAMAEISRRLRRDPALAAAHPDLAEHSASGYLRRRYEPPEAGGELPRVEGEVSRPHLWERVIAYMDGGSGRAGPIYCRPEHDDGRAIAWSELLAPGSVVYGGVGTTRYRLDYDDPECAPFRDVFRRPRRFAFFVPTPADLEIPQGIILNSGRSTMSDERARIRFATSTFNSGKATPAVDMPEENPMYVSLALAGRLGLAAGDRARVTNARTGESLVLPVVPTDRVKGDSVYVSFHKCRAELVQGRYLNDLTDHEGRCPYTSQSNFKITTVRVERVTSPAPPGSGGGNDDIGGGRHAPPEESVPS